MGQWVSGYVMSNHTILFVRYSKKRTYYVRFLDASSSDHQIDQKRNYNLNFLFLIENYSLPQ